MKVEKIYKYSRIVNNKDLKGRKFYDRLAYRIINGSNNRIPCYC